MKKRIIKPAAALASIIFISAIILLACSKSGSGYNNGGGNNTGNNISIANFAFSASTLTVSTGTKVTWTNNDAAAHTVTADDNSFNSGNIAPGATFSYTFTAAGTYSYHCNIHTGMKAKIVVND